MSRSEEIKGSLTEYLPLYMMKTITNQGGSMMDRRMIIGLLCGLIAATPITALADSKDDRIAELESEVAALQETVADLREQLAAGKSTNQDEYNIGEPWVVEGQWKLTVDSVEETDERNEYSDYHPAAVYIVTFTYENIGYKDPDGLSDGLYFILDDSIVDAGGKMGYSYPGDITMYPQETPVGATCEGQVCIGVDNPGSFKINVEHYDGNDVEQKATFNVTVDQ